MNSLRVRLPQVLQWMERQQPDILCLQETKLIDANFPVDVIQKAGYHVAYAGQKTYNGMAILSKQPAQDLLADLPGLDDPQRRVLIATVGDARVLNVYVPNGFEMGSDKFAYKLTWLEKLSAYVAAQLAEYGRLVLLGDFNIAPENDDVPNPTLWEGSVLFSEPVRAAFKRLRELGLYDAFRKFDQEAASFTWWDYRAGAFRRNNGLRIDHILCSRVLYEKCTACSIDKAPRGLERPSDHAPVIAVFEG